MDEAQFLPLRSEELGPDILRLIRQLHRLAIDIAAVVVSEGLGRPCRAADQRTTTSAGSLTSTGSGVDWLRLTLWSDLWSTPIWLEIENTDHSDSLDFRPLFADLENRTPPGVFLRDDRLVFPIELPRGVDRDVVLRAAVEQVRAIVGRIGDGSDAGP